MAGLQLLLVVDMGCHKLLAVLEEGPEVVVIEAEELWTHVEGLGDEVEENELAQVDHSLVSEGKSAWLKRWSKCQPIRDTACDDR